jgi:hypothetical protein
MVTTLLITVVHRKTDPTAIRSPSGEQSRTFRNRYHKICGWILHSSRTYLCEISGIFLFTSSFYFLSGNYVTVFELLFFYWEREREWAWILITLNRSSLFSAVLIQPMLITNWKKIIWAYIVCLFLARQPPVGHGLLVHEVSRSHTTMHHSP